MWSNIGNWGRKTNLLLRGLAGLLVVLSAFFAAPASGFGKEPAPDGPSGINSIDLMYFNASNTVCDQVTIYWGTRSESDTAAYLIYRNTVNSSATATLISDWIPAMGGPGLSWDYEWVDTAPIPGVTTWYFLAEILGSTGAVDFKGGTNTVAAACGQPTPTSTPTFTPTSTPAFTSTPTPTSGVPVNTPTRTPTPTATRTSTPTATFTPTATRTATSTPATIPSTSTPTPTGTPVDTATPTPTTIPSTSTPTPTGTPVDTATPTPTAIPSTSTPTPTRTPGAGGYVLYLPVIFVSR